MRKYIVIFIFSLFAINSFSQDFYVTPKGKFPLGKIDKKRIIVKFKEKTSETDKNKSLTKVSLENFKLLPETRTKSANKKLKGRGDFISLTKDLPETEVKGLISELNEDKSVLYAAPLYVAENGDAYFHSNEFIVKLKYETTRDQFINQLKAYNVEIVRPVKYMDRTYLLALNDKHANLVDVSNQFYYSGLFEYTEPNFAQLKKTKSSIIQTKSGVDPNWQLLKIQADMAWSINTGSGIKIAVIDDGIELSHSEFAGRLLPGYDCFGITNGASEPPSSHGTECTGFIISAPNSKCATGVAYDCNIIPIRWLYNEVMDDNTIEVTATNEQLATAINWAWISADADILSCSWRLLSGYSSIVDGVLKAASLTGRGSKGCPIFFASGNEGVGKINFPGTLEHVITVGATNSVDKRATGWGDNGDKGSNWGKELDIVAPGDVMVTTYIDNSCTDNFVGTSFATPIAAAVMALILSKDPDLDLETARYILESTCEKIAGYEFNGIKQNGSWNQEVGYGRINAYKALTVEVPDDPYSSFVPDFTYSKYIIAPGMSVSFVATPTLNSGDYISSYRWNFGDGTTSTEKSPTHIYASEGEYTVSLYAVKVNNNSGSESNQVIKNNVIKVNQQWYENTVVNSAWFNENDVNSYANIGDENGNCTDYENWGIEVLRDDFNTKVSGCNAPNHYAFNDYEYIRESVTFDQATGNYTCTGRYESIVKCIEGEWYASHGTPAFSSISPSNSGLAQSIETWSSYGREIDNIRVDEVDIDPSEWIERRLKQGEGFYYQFATPLNPSKIYKLKFTAKSTFSSNFNVDFYTQETLDKLNISLTNGLQPQIYGASNIKQECHQEVYELPSYSFFKYDIGHLNTAIDEDWRCFEIYFVPPANGYFNQLWIYPETEKLPVVRDIRQTKDNGDIYAAGAWWNMLYMDDIYIGELGTNCVERIIYTDNNNLPTETLASNEIVAQGNVNVLSGQNVTFSAATKVVLKPGFTAHNGSTFSAVIGGCTTDDNLKAIAENLNAQKSDLILDQDLNSDYLNSKVHFPNQNINYNELSEEMFSNLESFLIEETENFDSEELNLKKWGISIYPNPFSEHFKIKFDSTEGLENIEVYNLNGTQIICEDVNSRSIIEFDLTSRPAGVYLVKINKFSESIEYKIIKN